MTEPQPDGPLQLNPQDVIAELEAMPEARPYWALAQERAARKAIFAQMQDQTSELEQLRNELARRDRAAETPAAPESGVVTKEL